MDTLFVGQSMGEGRPRCCQHCCAPGQLMSERVVRDKQRVDDSSKQGMVSYACLRRGNALSVQPGPSVCFTDFSMTKMTKLIKQLIY